MEGDYFRQTNKYIDLDDESQHSVGEIAPVPPPSTNKLFGFLNKTVSPNIKAQIKQQTKVKSKSQKPRNQSTRMSTNEGIRNDITLQQLSEQNLQKMISLHQPPVSSKYDLINDVDGDDFLKKQISQFQQKKTYLKIKKVQKFEKAANDKLKQQQKYGKEKDPALQARFNAIQNYF